MDIAWRSCTRMLSGKLKIFSFAKEVISIYQFISVCIQLSASKPVYSFASLVEDSRENHTDLIIPDGFPKEIFAKYYTNTKVLISGTSALMVYWTTAMMECHSLSFRPYLSRTQII